MAAHLNVNVCAQEESAVTLAKTRNKYNAEK